MNSFEKIGILIIVGIVALVLALACYSTGSGKKDWEEKGLGKEGRTGTAGEGSDPEEIPADLNLFSGDLEAVERDKKESAGILPLFPPQKSIQASEPAEPFSREPNLEMYEVKKGDTLFTIARSYLGKGSLWQRIVQANPGIDPHKIHPGLRVKIPVENERLEDPSPLSQKERKLKEAQENLEGKYYVVKKGDTLCSISQRFYGTRSRWKDILEANKQRIADVRNIPEGLRIRLP